MFIIIIPLFQPSARALFEEGQMNLGLMNHDAIALFLIKRFLSWNADLIEDGVLSVPDRITKDMGKLLTQPMISSIESLHELKHYALDSFGILCFDNYQELFQPMDNFFNPNNLIPLEKRNILNQHKQLQILMERIPTLLDHFGRFWSHNMVKTILVSQKSVENASFLYIYSFLYSFI